MKVRRRALLAALALAGCAPDPTVAGSPADAATSPAPTQSPASAAAATALAGLASTVEAGRAVEGQPEAYAAWADAALAALEAVMSRLAAEDPVAGGDAVFERPTVDVAVPEDPDAAAEALEVAADGALVALTAGALGALDQPSRLLYASAASTAQGLRAVGAPPVPGEAEPGHFQATTDQAAVTVALSRTWALIYGLGVGLGRLDGDDALHAHGEARLIEAKRLRNRLREQLSGPVSQPASFEMPTAMGTPAEIREGWGGLELGLLTGIGRLVAAGGPEAPARVELMLAQTDAVSALPWPLPHWPGWA